METVDDLGGMGYPGQVYGLGGGVTLDCGHVIPVTQCGRWGHTGNCGCVSPDTVFVEGYHTRHWKCDPRSRV